MLKIIDKIFTHSRHSELVSESNIFGSKSKTPLMDRCRNKFGMTEMLILFHIVLTLILISTSTPVYSITTKLNWEELNLTNSQKMDICKLDKHWKEVSTDLRQSLVRYQNQLKIQLSDRFSTDEDIKYSQKQIQLRQQQLQNEATDTFLKKRQVLNQYQRAKLHEMIFNRNQ